MQVANEKQDEIRGWGSMVIVVLGAIVYMMLNEEPSSTPTPATQFSSTDREGIDQWLDSLRGQYTTATNTSRHEFRRHEDAALQATPRQAIGQNIRWSLTVRRMRTDRLGFGSSFVEVGVPNTSSFANDGEAENGTARIHQLRETNIPINVFGTVRISDTIQVASVIKGSGSLRPDVSDVNLDQVHEWRVHHSNSTTSRIHRSGGDSARTTHEN